MKCPNCKKDFDTKLVTKWHKLGESGLCPLCKKTILLIRGAKLQRTSTGALINPHKKNKLTKKERRRKRKLEFDELKKG